VIVDEGSLSPTSSFTSCLKGAAQDLTFFMLCHPVILEKVCILLLLDGRKPYNRMIREEVKEQMRYASRELGMKNAATSNEKKGINKLPCHVFNVLLLQTSE
jgi:hypothetical protein